MIKTRNHINAGYGSCLSGHPWCLTPTEFSPCWLLPKNHKVHYAAPSPEGLAAQVDAFLTWFNQTNPNTGSRPMEGLVRASLSHLWFETLHPFDDGNGRIGRAILQLALGQDMGQAGRIVTLSRQIESCKDQYYSELERAQRSKSMDVTAWVEWMLLQISQASEFASRTIDSAVQRIKFQAIMATVALNERQQKTMKKLLDAGPKGYIGGMTLKFDTCGSIFHCLFTKNT